LSGVPDAVTNGNLPQARGVGAQIWASRATNGTTAPGVTIGGSNISAWYMHTYYGTTSDYYGWMYGVAPYNYTNKPTLAGTWRCMGPGSAYTGSNSISAALFLRIA